ncbi:MAG: TIGR00730 family Rossman fold protein [Calditrichia bacterium]|nr:TIGR00730 family Rossman fold protein [Calditrichia bacterium]
MKRISVFCGSSPGIDKEYTIVAKELGQALVNNGLGLVFGGGAVGLMGVIARSVMEKGGEVVGVIPEAMVKKELALKELTDLRIVGSMHERKALIAELSDGFIAMPGGLGTIEEIFEALTWSQLGIHNKPCGFLNARNYFHQLIKFLDHMSDQHFVNEKHRSMIMVENDPETLLAKFKSYQHPDVDKSAWALNMLNT